MYIYAKYIHYTKRRIEKSYLTIVDILLFLGVLLGNQQLLSIKKNFKKMSKICMKKYVNMKYLIEISHFICSKLSKNFFKMLTVTHIKCRKEGLTFLGTCPLRSSLLKKNLH